MILKHIISAVTHNMDNVLSQNSYTVETAVEMVSVSVFLRAHIQWNLTVVEMVFVSDLVQCFSELIYSGILQWWKWFLYRVLQGFFYKHHPADRITHTMAFYTSRGALAGSRNSSICPP